MSADLKLSSQFKKKSLVLQHWSKVIDLNIYISLDDLSQVN